MVDFLYVACDNISKSVVLIKIFVEQRGKYEKENDCFIDC